jgi:hypothetical protein
MQITINDLLRRSFRMIGVLRRGFQPSTSDIIDALVVLNAMLEGWATDELNLFTVFIAQYDLTPSKQSYTIGPSSGDFTAARPVRIDRANLIILSNPQQPLRKPLQILNSQGWAAIKLQTVQSVIPIQLFYDPTYPLGTLYLWPMPTLAYQLELFTFQALAGSFSSGSQTFDMPPGYLDAVAYNLAVRLSSEWQKPLRQDVVALASESLAMIQRLNDQTPLMECDAGVMPFGSSRAGAFNRLTGDML